MTSVSGKVDPVVRRIRTADIAEALGQGLRDFQAMPLYGLLFGALYAGGGVVILLCLTAFGLVYLAYPLAAGFALLGPFVGAGLVVVVKNVVSAFIERWNFLLGAIFVAIVILMPEGLVPGTARLWRSLWRKRAHAVTPPAAKTEASS